MSDSRCAPVSEGAAAAKSSIIVAAGSSSGRSWTSFTEFGDAEVENLDAITSEAIRFEPDVVGLQIPMNDALLVCFVNRGTDLIEDVGDPLERQTFLFKQERRRAYSRRDTPSRGKQLDPAFTRAKPKSVTSTTFG